MNKIIIPVLVSVLVLGFIGVQDVYGPDDKPEKLTLGGTSFDPSTQSFVVTMSANFGTVTAASNADFTLSVELTITDPLTGNTEDETYALDIDTFDLNLNYGELIEFELSDLGWDRILGNIPSFEGYAGVTVNAQILNPAGKPVATAESLTETVHIMPPPPEGKTVELTVTDFAGNPLVNHECGVITTAPGLIFTGITGIDGKAVIGIPPEVTALYELFCPITPEYCPFVQTLNPPFVLPEGTTSFDIQRTLLGGPAGCPF